jgi:hypothetical protein
VRTAEYYRDIAIADAKVLVAGPASAPLTERELILVAHTVEFMHAIMGNVLAQNQALLARLDECDCGDEPPREMAVLAG